MAHKQMAVALGLIVAAAPALAASPEPITEAGPDAQYCMRVEVFTGSRIEKVRCWTRAEWAEQGVDVDKEWAKEGVSIIDREGSRPVKG